MATSKWIISRTACLVTSSLVCLFLRDVMVIFLPILLQWHRMEQRHKPCGHPRATSHCRKTMLLMDSLCAFVMSTAFMLITWETISYVFCISLPAESLCISLWDVLVSEWHHALELLRLFFRRLWQHVSSITSSSLDAYNVSSIHHSTC